MTKDYTPDRLDIKAFVQAGAHLQGHDSLLKYERLMQEAQGLRPDLYVDWQARGELRAVEGLAPELWLHLTVQAIQPLLCQRCQPGALLAFNLGRTEGRVQHDIGEQAEALGEIRFQAAQGNTCFIAPGTGRQRGAEVGELIGQLLRAARHRAFLQHRRSEAGQPGLVGCVG